MNPVLELNNVSVSFEERDTVVQVLSEVNLEVFPSEIMAVVGSSGSGKSVLAHAVMGLLPSNATTGGEIRYLGEPLKGKRLELLRGKEITLIPQSVTYLDPSIRVGEQVQGARKDAQAIRQREEAMQRFHLCGKAQKMYPFQYSGGMARRALLAGAYFDNANLILADEPTPGLDLDLAVEALACLREMADTGKSVLLITHDIDLAVHVADRVAVFYSGTMLEIFFAKDFIKGVDFLRHPYTKALYQALPQNGFVPVAGTQPLASKRPKGCCYRARCDWEDERCLEYIPLQKVGEGLVRCVHANASQ